MSGNLRAWGGMAKKTLPDASLPLRMGKLSEHRTGRYGTPPVARGEASPAGLPAATSPIAACVTLPLCYASFHPETPDVKPSVSCNGSHAAVYPLAKRRYHAQMPHAVIAYCRFPHLRLRHVHGLEDDPAAGGVRPVPHGSH